MRRALRVLLPASILFGIGAIASIPRKTGPVRYRLHYEFEIPKPEGKVEELKIWAPMPVQNHEQKVLFQEIHSPQPYLITQEQKYGNSMIHFEVSAGTYFPFKVEAVYEIERTESFPTALSALDAKSAWEPGNFLGVDKKVPNNGVIRKLAEEETAGLSHPDAKIDRIYQYVVKTMAYNKDGKGWGEGDAIWACSNKRGNCTDFHSLLIGMARSQGIPARFEIGLPIPPTGTGEIPGYHCWARAYSKKRGWIPMDASEAKKKGKPSEFFGYMPNDRIHFTTGRDLVLEPRQKGDPLNYFIYPYMELNGKPWQGFKRSFRVEKIAGIALLKR